MHQKDLIRSAWMSAGLYDEDDPKLRQFLDQLDDPQQCWAGMTRLLRRSFAAYKNKVIAPILADGDAFTRLAVIRALADSDDEAPLIERFVSTSDPVRDEVELMAIAERAVPRFDKALRRKRHLTAAVLGVLAARPQPPRRPRRKSRADAVAPSA